jgi:Tol biopolymer transport system component
MSSTPVARLFFSLIVVFCGAMIVESLSAPALTRMPILSQSASPTPTPVPGNGLPAVSPDGSRIAFTSNRGGADDVFVISPSGTNEKQLTNTRESEGNLAWAASSKQILFSVFKDNTSHLYGIDPDGKNQYELASVPGRAPTLSPDGRRLVYMAGTWTATRLMVSALDGTNAKQITDGSSIAWNNHWSPDGKLIAFTGRNGPKDELAVFVMNVDGSSPRQVTHIPPEEGGAQWPVWSPDGRRLAIQVNSRAQKNSAHIWIIDVATGEAQKLATHTEAYLDETPSWFPDGKRLAFQSNRTGKMEVWLMSADGSGARQVTGLSTVTR